MKICIHCGQPIKRPHFYRHCSFECYEEHQYNKRLTQSQVRTLEFLAESGNWVRIGNTQSINSLRKPDRVVTLIDASTVAMDGRAVTVHRITDAGKKWLEYNQQKQGGRR